MTSLETREAGVHRELFEFSFELLLSPHFLERKAGIEDVGCKNIDLVHTPIDLLNERAVSLVKLGVG